MAKQDPYGCMRAEIDASASYWTWCDTCQEMMPSNHVCGKIVVASTSDLEMQEDINYWSVEAVLRGWHGEGMRREARSRVKQGRYDPNKTKSTTYDGFR